MSRGLGSSTSFIVAPPASYPQTSCYAGARIPQHAAQTLSLASSFRGDSRNFRGATASAVLHRRIAYLPSRVLLSSSFSSFHLCLNPPTFSYVHLSRCCVNSLDAFPITPVSRCLDSHSQQNTRGSRPLHSCRSVRPGCSDVMPTAYLRGQRLSVFPELDGPRPAERAPAICC